ncbi:hypothetical protein ACFYY3_07655 [Streptomyces sp. NPDC001812]|uniref:hypothetical protein n=1 Tax=Streptomyces sp. NPDC001812 TaxID=3364611 RepID=UPI00369822A8
MVGWWAAVRRVRVETAAVYAMAVLVYGSAVVGVVFGGPWTIVWFLPALLGSLVAIWCVRHAARWEASAAARAAAEEEEPRH